MAAGIIGSVAMNPAMAQSMRDRSFERVTNEYRFESYAEKLVSLAESLAGVRLRRPELRLHGHSEQAA